MSAAPGAPAVVEQVVLVDDAGAPIGVADKAHVHGLNTPLHLAFSCYGFAADGRMLLTRRALAKRTWPGVWSNACCGHPAPGESIEDAVARRVRHELGVEPRNLRVVLPDFRYRAIAADGIVEHEVCPVYAADLPTSIAPDPDEILEWEWVQPAAFLEIAERTPFLLSPWSVLQAAEFRRSGLLSSPASDDDAAERFETATEAEAELERSERFPHCTGRMTEPSAEITATSDCAPSTFERKCGKI